MTAYFAFILITFLQASCMPKRSSDHIVVASAGKITSLDPAQATTFESLQLLSGLGDTLYQLNDDGSLKPRLASGLPIITNNGKTISIPLRKDVLFHDGTPFNSEAMSFSIKRFMRIGRLSYLLKGRIESVQSPSPYLISFNLTRPSSSLNGLLTSVNLTPVSPHAYSNYKDRFLNDSFIGTGQYKLVRFHRQHQRIEPFDLYWGPDALNTGIDFIKLSNSTALFGAMKTREIDVLMSNSIDEDQHLALNKMALNGQLVEGKGRALEIGYITFRSNKEPLDNLIIRKALSYSIDRELIAERVSYRMRRPLRSLVPPSLRLDQELPWPSYNPKKASTLLRSVGYCGEKKLILPFTFRSNVPADKLLALTWQSQIKRDLGECMQLILDGVESITVYRQLGKGAFDSVMLDWRGAYPHPSAYLYPLLSCTKAVDSICEEGEAVASGSFWTSQSMQNDLTLSDEFIGEESFKLLNLVEQAAAKGSAYLPVWLVTPKAWVQNYLSPPEFDAAGQLILGRLRQL